MREFDENNKCDCDNSDDSDECNECDDCDNCDNCDDCDDCVEFNDECGEHDECDVIRNSDDIDEVYEIEGSEDENEEEDNFDDNIRQAPLRIFSQHDAPVYCCTLNSNETLAASGGGDDKAYVWKTSDCKVILEIKHQDSIIDVAFNKNNNLFASADMIGFIQVHDINTNSLVFEYEVSEDIMWMKFWQSDTIICGTESGSACIISVDYNKNIYIPGCGATNMSGILSKDETKLVMGYENGTIIIWDLLKNAVEHTIKDRNSENMCVLCLDIKADNSLIAAGFINSFANIISTRTGRVIWSAKCDTPEKTSSVEQVAFSPKNPYFLTATVTGTIKVWDLNSQQVRNEIAFPGGVSKIVWEKDGNHFYAAGLNGKLKIFDARNGSLTSVLCGHSNTILDFNVCDQYVLTSSDDKSSCLFMKPTF